MVTFAKNTLIGIGYFCSLDKSLWWHVSDRLRYCHNKCIRNVTTALIVRLKWKNTRGNLMQKSQLGHTKQVTTFSQTKQILSKIPAESKTHKKHAIATTAGAQRAFLL